MENKAVVFYINIDDALTELCDEMHKQLVDPRYRNPFDFSPYPAWVYDKTQRYDVLPFMTLIFEELNDGGQTNHQGDYTPPVKFLMASGMSFERAHDVHVAVGGMVVDAIVSVAPSLTMYDLRACGYTMHEDMRSMVLCVPPVTY